MSTDISGLIVAILASAIGATWALRSKLGDIEKAMLEHVAADAAVHAAQEAKIFKLEGRRSKR